MIQDQGIEQNGNGGYLLVFVGAAQTHSLSKEA